MLESYEFNILRKYKSSHIVSEEDFLTIDRFRSIGFCTSAEVEGYSKLTPLGLLAIKAEEKTQCRVYRLINIIADTLRG